MSTLDGADECPVSTGNALEECPLEVDTRGGQVVIALDTGERINLADISIEAAFALSDEFLRAADIAAANSNPEVVGDEQ